MFGLVLKRYCFFADRILYYGCFKQFEVSSQCLRFKFLQGVLSFACAKNNFQFYWMCVESTKGKINTFFRWEIFHENRCVEVYIGKLFYLNCMNIYCTTPQNLCVHCSLLQYIYVLLSEKCADKNKLACYFFSSNYLIKLQFNIFLSQHG